MELPQGLSENNFQNFGSLSITCNPFLLNGTLKGRLEKYIPIESYSKFIQQLLLNLCVDNLSKSFNNVEDSFKFFKVSNKRLVSN